MMDRLDLIKRNLKEIISEEELVKLLKEKKILTVYWGTAPTGRIHVGYFIPITKIIDLLKAGFKVKILLADLHAYLDDQKTPWDLLDKRTIYYKEMILSMLDSVGVDHKKLEFIVGSDFQLNPEYMLDVLRISADVTMNRVKRAAAEVVRFTNKPKVGGFIYPIMQALDEQYLEADAQFGGEDQRHIMVFAREYLPKIGYKTRVELMNPMLPGLTGEKMSSSVEKNKIDLLDSKEYVEKKMNEAYCVAGDKNNGILAFVQYVIFPLKGKLIITRDKKFGGDLEYKEYSKLENDFVDKKLHPLDLKKSVALEINKLLEPIRKHFKNKMEIVKKAYPQ